jgi:small membrane protein
MSVFQILTIPLAIFLFLRSAFRLVRGDHPRGTALLGAVVWFAAALTIYDTELTIRMARVMGVGRGADLVLYLFTLSFLLSVFYFYHRILKLESSLSEIVRLLAISEAAQRWPQGVFDAENEGKQTEKGEPPGGGKEQP